MVKTPTMANPRLFHARGVVGAQVGDVVVVFDERSGSLHELNPTASMVWTLLDGSSRTEVSDDLQLRFAVDASVLANDVDGVIESFLACGLLSDRRNGEAIGASRTTDSGGLGSKGRETWARRLATLAGRVPDTKLLGPFVAGNLCFEVATDDPDIAGELLRALRSLEGERAGDSNGVVARYTIVRRNAGWSLLFGTEDRLSSLGRRNDVSLTVATMLWHLNQQIVSACGDSVALHAGAVAGTVGAAIFPGVSNAGKSTLVGGLVRDGWGYLSDEIAMLDPSTAKVASIPKAFAFDPGSFAVFPEAAPDVAPAFTYSLARKWIVDPAVLGRVGTAASVELIIAPRFSPSAEPQATLMSAREALDMLVGSAFSLDAAGFLHLAFLATTVPAYRLVSGDLAATLAVLAPLMAPLGRGQVT